MDLANFRNDIATGVNNPYKQFTYSVPANSIIPVFYTFNFFRILSLSSATNFKVRFGASGSVSDVVGGGIGYELPYAVDRVDLINESGASIDVTIALAIGRIFDDRLSVSGSLAISNTATTPIYTLTANKVLVNPAAFTVSSSPAVLAATVSANQTGILVQNLGSSALYYGESSVAATLAARGIILRPFESFYFDGSAVPYLVSVGSSDVRVMQFLSA